MICDVDISDVLQYMAGPIKKRSHLIANMLYQCHRKLETATELILIIGHLLSNRDSLMELKNVFLILKILFSK